LDVDVAVIGSGAGGLAAAVALARAGQRVAVFEQHSLPGGWTHSFMLEGHRFSPGVHYVGGLQPYELNPEGFDHVQLGDTRFDIPRGKQAFAARLAAAYPEEARGIHGYLDAVERIDAQLSRLPRSLLGTLAMPFRNPDILRWGWRTAEQMISSYVTHPEVKGVLSAQAGDHGLPPSRVSALVHAAITAHYFEGGWYPKGGGGALPRAHTRALVRHGGAVHLRSPVARILLEQGKAVGLRLEDGTEVRAGAVISNADPWVTFERLVGRENLAPQLRRNLDRTECSVSCLSLFMAARIDPEEHGLDSGNEWLYASADVDAAYRGGSQAWTPGEVDIPGLFLTVTTLKDPSKARRGVHTMEAFCFVDYDAYRQWEGSVSGARPADYEDVKDRVQDAMLTALERRVPGLRDRLVFSALGTPLTNAHYCGATRGNLYGTAKLRSQVGPGSFAPRSSVPGLFLCGASTLSHGVAGAARSGVVAAARILGCPTRELLPEGQPEITLLDAETERRRAAREAA
jgi:phytoene dehydrogenase-like protein